jgi:uncharacterized protein YdhG (YjbR/CyaY superfamily)
MQAVEQFIENLPKDERLIAKRLRQLVLDCDPRLQEKLSFGVPYYAHHRAILFIWPASHVVYGTPRKRPSGVTLGFCYGNLLSNDQGLLLKENRKQVYIIKFSSADEIDERLITEIIQEAILVDDTFKKKKKKK